MNVTILLKATYRFDEMPIKISMSFFTKIEKSFLKFIEKNKRPQKAEVNMGGITILDFKTKQHSTGAKKDMETNGTK
jgi:hypothetical protein